MEIVCRCGYKSLSCVERRNHLKSKLHSKWQKQFEYINTNDINIISHYKYIKEECQILQPNPQPIKNGMN